MAKFRDFVARHAASHESPQRVYSVEKLPFSVEAIFQFYENAAEKLTVRIHSSSDLHGTDCGDA
jgi:hypothetical protein